MKKLAIIILSALIIIFSKSEVNASAAERVTFGSYPQNEITGASLTSDITGASYDASGKAVVGTNTYYKLTWKYDAKGNQVQLTIPKYYRCEPICWKVMSNANGESKLIAERALDAGVYSGSDNSEYASSYLKKWMEETFFEAAFSSYEKTSFITGTKPEAPSFADIISASYGFTGNSDRCVAATNFADSVAGNVHAQSINYWIQSGYISADGSANTVVSGKGTYSNLFYTVPVIRIQTAAATAVSQTPVITPSPAPSDLATNGALSIPVYVKVKNTGAKKQKITWGKSKDAISYIIYRSTSRNGNYKKIGTTKRPAFVSTKLTIGKKYYYKIVAVNGAIQSKASKIAVKKAGIPNKPVLTVTKTKRGLICRWTNLTGAQRIVIYDKINKSSFAKLFDGTLTDKTKKGCILHPSNASGKIYIKVRTYNKAGGKKYYSPYSKTVSVRI